MIKIITVIKSINKKEKTCPMIGAWVMDDECDDKCLFIPKDDISKVIDFIDRIEYGLPGSEETYGCINCSLTFTNQFVISDMSEYLIFELYELTGFVNDLEGILNDA